MTEKVFAPGISFESDCCYRADRTEYHIYPHHANEIIDCWWTFLNSSGEPLRAAFVLRCLRNVTIDLGGARLIFHGRILPFAIFDCENVKLANFSIDYDRPFFTQGTVLESRPGSVVLEIPPLYSYRLEGHDFIATAATWEHRLNRGDLLLRCFDPTSGIPSDNSGVILALIGDQIYPTPNPPLPIHHLLAEDASESADERRVRLTGLPHSFIPRTGEILAMTHEDRRKTGILMERSGDTVLTDIRLRHVPAFGITASHCHNIRLDGCSMYPDEDFRERVVTVNADGFHCYHCSGLVEVVNCRFENLLDDAINIHGNYLICTGWLDSRTLIMENRCYAKLHMEFVRPGDPVYIYRANTKEIRAVLTVESADYTPADQDTVLHVRFREEIPEAVEAGDLLENRSMPEITVRNCRIRCMNGFRISSCKPVLIEDCCFETNGFAVLFSGDMNYYYENGGVEDVTIRNNTFRRCGIPVQTSCGFRPTKQAPCYHRNIHFLSNTVLSPRDCVMRLQDVDGIEYRGCTVEGLRDDVRPLMLTRCTNIITD